MNTSTVLPYLKIEDTNMTMNFTLDMILDLYARKDYTIIGLYVPVFLAAVIANTVVILVVFKGQYMRSVTNYFLVNLSVADLLVTILCMPNACWLAYTSVYYFGEYTCKIIAYLQSFFSGEGVRGLTGFVLGIAFVNLMLSNVFKAGNNIVIMSISVASSIFTITAMAVDRYLAIAKPFGIVYKCFNKTTTVIVIISLWITSLILFLPILWIYRLNPTSFNITDEGLTNVTVAICSQDWQSSNFSQYILGIIWFTFMFALPGVIMLFAYSMMGRTLCSAMPAFDNDSTCTQQRNRVIRDRKRVACILLLLAFVFAACWLPYHLVILKDDIDKYSQYTEQQQQQQSEDGNSTTTTQQPQTEDSETEDTIRRYLLLIGHANSALNPIIYCALSRKFRNSIRNLFCVQMSFRRRRQLVKWQDSSGSGTQMHYLHRIRTAPSIQNHLQSTLRSRYQSSQKTTKTFAL